MRSDLSQHYWAAASFKTVRRQQPSTLLSGYSLESSHKRLRLWRNAEMKSVFIMVLVVLIPTLAFAQDPTEIVDSVTTMFGLTGDTKTLVIAGLGALFLLCGGISAAFADTKLGKLAGIINAFGMNFGEAKNKNPANE